jgi:hypothetical protein
MESKVNKIQTPALKRIFVYMPVHIVRVVALTHIGGRRSMVA